MMETYKDLDEARGVAWANTQVSSSIVGSIVHACRTWPAELSESFNHWSRCFEYDWILTHGDFGPDQHVLDAGGAGCPLQYLILNTGASVMNVDKYTEPIIQAKTPHHIIVEANLEALPLTDNYFDRVACASVLEHTDNPAQCLRELWRVLKPGGRLLVTLDVADPPIGGEFPIRLNEAAVAELVAPLGIPLPPEPYNLLRKDLGGLTNLKVLCFYRDKQI